MTPQSFGGEAPVLVNGQPVEGAEGATLADLLARLGQPADAVATALNGQFVPRAARGEVGLSRGDQVTVFKAIVGG
ncbi:sulfur carrier protein ThiS [Ideonella sp. DXS29W]|uniref:Sulfur carrier protein ThiS n=1 Tax=Ideonella lacteola TaxID=2984193 RepID=A0ABU9BL66_9BURK